MIYFALNGRSYYSGFGLTKVNRRPSCTENWVWNFVQNPLNISQILELDTRQSIFFFFDVSTTKKSHIFPLLCQAIKVKHTGSKNTRALTSSRNSFIHFSLSSFNSFLMLSICAYILARREAFSRIDNSSLMFESPIFNDDCSRRRSAILKTKKHKMLSLIGSEVLFQWS